MNEAIRRIPHAIFIFIAVAKSKRKMGMRKDNAIINFVKKVAMVASQIDLWEFFFEDSSEMWMPSASENASAIATVRIPPMTAIRRFVPVSNPIMTPSVVIIPEVRPKLIPVFMDCLIRVLRLNGLLI